MGVIDWLADAVKNPNFGTARRNASYCDGKVVTAQKDLCRFSCRFLMNFQAAQRLHSVKWEVTSELKVLRSLGREVHGWEKVEIQKAIEKIEGRLHGSASAPSDEDRV